MFYIHVRTVQVVWTSKLTVLSLSALKIYTRGFSLVYQERANKLGLMMGI